jgi:peptidoglycan/xylan/chitin deacetylase (PgdA/CDA1 family)
MSTPLYEANHPAAFWQLRLPVPPAAHEWEEAAGQAASVLPDAARRPERDLEGLLEQVLGEAQFGPAHFRLGAARRAYYLLKPVLPRALTRRLRQAHAEASSSGFGLRWPIEDRYVRFQRSTLANLMRSRGLEEAPFLHLWPHGALWALVLTHDVESAAGVARVPMVAELEERLGFRSSFNFVPDRYDIPPGLLDDLRRRGFEVGVHDWNHDGKLFSSERTFRRRAAWINRQLKAWQARGFRAALTMRDPQLMQELELDYDLSFFDSDPFEPIPGGTMSIWPFFLGRFVELPYTLVQDHTLAVVLGERTADLWIEKASFIAANWGMALLNSHPDYLGREVDLKIYETFLTTMREADRCWFALPSEVARWWRARSATAAALELPEARVATAVLDECRGVRIETRSPVGQ